MFRPRIGHAPQRLDTYQRPRPLDYDNDRPRPSSLSRLDTHSGRPSFLRDDDSPSPTPTNWGAGNRYRRDNEDDISFVRRRDSELSDAGYTPVGYHGTNRANLNRIDSEGFDPSYAGSGQGLARGPGFYVSRDREFAEEYTEQSTGRYETRQFQRYGMDLEEDVRVDYDGDRGRPAVGRIYARDPQEFTLGRETSWGVLSSDGDPYGDRRPTADDSLWSPGGNRGRQANASQLESVYAPHTYDRLEVVDVTDVDDRNLGLSRQRSWDNYSDGDARDYRYEAPTRHSRYDSDSDDDTYATAPSYRSRYDSDDDDYRTAPSYGSRYDSDDDY